MRLFIACCRKLSFVAKHHTHTYAEILIAIAIATHTHAHAHTDTLNGIFMDAHIDVVVVVVTRQANPIREN